MDIAALLRPQEVACASYLQVLEGDAEASSQLGGGQDGLEALLAEYYDERGWDRRTGKPSDEKLKELNLEGII